MQLEHHQCVRLFKAVYGLVNAPRRWYHRVAKDLRYLRGGESVMEPCLWTFRDENSVIHVLCLVHVDDFMLACSDSPFGQHVFDSIKSIYEWESGSHECSNSAAHEAHKPLPNTGTWTGFEISFKESAKEIVLINLPSHRRRDRKSKITPLEMSQLRALNGQSLRLGMQYLPQLLAISVAVDGTNATSHCGYDS